MAFVWHVCMSGGAGSSTGSGDKMRTIGIIVGVILAVLIIIAIVIIILLLLYKKRFVFFVYSWTKMYF